jgi:hypothetical protein
MKFTDDEQRLYENRKESIIISINRNFDWSKKTSDIEIQVRKWTIAFCLIFFGFIVKNEVVCIKWFHYFISVSGIFFFMSHDMLQHYYSKLMSKHRFKLNQTMMDLPNMTVEELKNLKILSTESKVLWTRGKKLKVFLSMGFNETILYFYGSLLLITMFLLLALDI